MSPNTVSPFKDIATSDVVSDVSTDIGQEPGLSELDGTYLTKDEDAMAATTLLGTGYRSAASSSSSSVATPAKVDSVPEEGSLITSLALNALPPVTGNETDAGEFSTDGVEDDQEDGLGDEWKPRGNPNPTTATIKGQVKVGKPGQK